MAKYYVDLDLTMSVQMWLDADSKEAAEQMAKEKVAKEPMYYAQQGLFVEATVTALWMKLNSNQNNYEKDS